MREEIWKSLSKMISARRPAWKFILEDSLVRIMTGQFVVDWVIVDEIRELHKEYQVVEVISHNTFGIVICIRYIGGE